MGAQVTHLSFEDINPDNIHRTRDLIKPYLRETPVFKLSNTQHKFKGDPKIVFKLENHQPTGSFKVRGAVSKVISLKDSDRPLIAVSGGNHGLAVAYAGLRFNRRVDIYLPHGIQIDKINNMRSLKANVHIEGENLGEAMIAAEKAAEERNAIFIHPFKDPAVILGQGTLGPEIIKQIPNIDVALIAIGGGGLIGGLGAYLKAINPKIKVIGVEPKNYPTMKQALEHGQPHRLAATPTIMPTLAALETAHLNYELAKNYVDDIILVSEEDVKSGVQFLWQKLKIAAEYSGAAAFTALYKEKMSYAPGSTICPLICGAGHDGIA